MKANHIPLYTKLPSRSTKQVPHTAGPLAFVAYLVFLFCNSALAQTTGTFDITAYKQFLNANQNMSPEQLRALYPAGIFAAKGSTRFGDALYSDSIRNKYDLTDYEISLIENNGFMVSERLKSSSFGDAFLDIYRNDLPLFITTDAILHALHMSYDAMLKDIEQGLLIAKLDSLLERLHAQVPLLANRYASIPEMKQSLDDIDLYLTVPRKLLGDQIECQFPENADDVIALLNLVKAKQASTYPLFAGQGRDIDFSQFTVRGHYTQTPELGRYFQAMMWLGRIEIYLIAPQHVLPPVPDSDVQRQTIDAALLVEAAEASSSFELLEEMDSIIRYLVGESDNVTLPNLQSLLAMTKTDSANRLVDVERWKAFQDTLKSKPFAFQRILSQILYTDPLDPESVQPASSLLLLGQRFIIDSYITGNVVYDKIPNNCWRGLPSSLDVLFALGNSAAAQLLESELAQYHYSSNLAALRYLIDAYEPEFWTSTLYAGWLSSVRALNPPSDRSPLPAFMKTAAWWQEKMNTQLASWAQLRHDNLLYAKQSYTPGNICCYPFVYVEPEPAFYHALSEMAAQTSISLTQLLPSSFGYRYLIKAYWDGLKGIADTLELVAQKELSGTSLSDAENAFLTRVLYTNTGGMCGEPPYLGWYRDLYYTGEEGFRKTDLVVADVHTCPTDEFGAPVGWVLHVGTGPVNLAVLTAELPDRQRSAFIGPVMSYYEHVSTNFKRLTDDEWQSAYQVTPSFRPDFVNLYLADSTGNKRPGLTPSLITSVPAPPDNIVVPSTIVLGRNFPNPFNSSTIITFSIPQAFPNSRVELWIHNMLGQRVKQLLNRPMPAGKYAARWDGTTEDGSTAASGVYFYSLRVGNKVLTGKMSFVK